MMAPRLPSALADAKARKSLVAKAREIRNKTEFACRLRKLAEEILAKVADKQRLSTGAPEEFDAEGNVVMSEADARRALADLDVAEGRTACDAAANGELAGNMLSAAPGADAAEPLQPLTTPVRTKANLERMAALAESLLWRAHKIGAALRSEAAPFEACVAIARHLEAAADACEAACAELSAACRCWVGTQQDCAAAEELAPRAEKALRHLAEWARVGDSVARRGG